MAQFIGSGAAADRPGAFVYRGPKDDPDLSKAVGELLESSPRKFTVKYVGPDDITADSLKSVKLFAFPGGPDVDDLWEELEPVAQDIRDFVANGGRYLGFCLGAYIAGHSPGLGLLPGGTQISAESDEKDAQVKDDRDTMIQVNWSFSSGANAGKTAENRWVYFQEGSVVKNFVENGTSHVLARYSSTGHVAATLNKYGQGWVGTTGPHPEANQLWFDVVKLNATDGLQFDIGHDLIEATMSGGKNVKRLPSSGPTNGNGTDTKLVASTGSRSRNPIGRLFRR
ncbi:biotin protein ligase [Akanthomyces lecanii RCEF 1005]|uniref:Biotin protein ligase n=1 Tax=Akanthomyces lecanii RCEF 1005 TaxID=1081108 RepID=A0A162ISA1_CORDF|nr:biotin protein ligase [Akanthomyces lecanii RCEF 1005]